MVGRHHRHCLIIVTAAPLVPLLWLGLVAIVEKGWGTEMAVDVLGEWVLRRY